MIPTLRPGQEVVAVDTRRPEPGNLVVFEHPGHAGFWLIKRLSDDTGWVVSDNPEHGESDSRTLGPIPIDDLWDVVTELDEHTFLAACRLLTEEDEQLAGLVDLWGLPEFWRREPGFKTLVWLILEQQVSLESGAAMFGRLATLVGEITPHALADAGGAALRSIGVTRQKTSYLLDLAERITSGVVDLAGLERQGNDEARATLLSIRGIGPWTADAYLLSALRRPDMWPIGDRALQVGTAEVLGMRTIPDEDQLELLAEAWRPVRAAAARLIWHAYLSERGRVEPTDPTLSHEESWGA